jgi:anaerobic magnesium-protoporphyrin IX monomethyl ester cyclase
MRVLLADPPAKGTKIDDSYSNLGLLYLAGSLKSAFGRSELEVSYLGPKHDLKSHVRHVRESCPDVYGISFASKAADRAYDTIKAVREVCPKAWIMCGGAHATALPLDVFERSPTDIVVPGEGELGCVEIVKAIAGRSAPDFEQVLGIVYRQDGEVRATPQRPVAPDIDRIPFPAWELINFHDYPGMHLKKQPIESSMLISRGCPFQCTFCSQPVWKYQKPWLRARSANNILAEIELLYERGVREIYLTSDELNFNEQWALELCDSIASRAFPDMYFQCNLRADKVSPALAERLAQMKCWIVHLGMESANDRVLAGIGKRVTVGQIENAARMLSHAGIRVFAFMMLYQAWEEDGQLCWETSEEVEESLRFVKRLFHNKFIHYMSWQFCTPMPGAPLYEIAKRHNLYPRDEREVWQSFDEHEACMQLPGISRRCMQWKIKKGVLLKDWFMLRSGGISPRHIWRAWENMRALFK